MARRSADHDGPPDDSRGRGLLVLILLVLCVRGCLDARKERALEDYADNAAVLVRESNGQSKALFALLEGSGSPDQAVDAQNKVNGFRVQSASIVDRARDLDVPDEVSRRPALPARDARVPPRRPGADRRRPAGRARRRVPAPGLRGRGAPDAGLPRERRDLRGALQARPRQGAARPGRQRRDGPGQRLHPGHRVAAARPWWPTRSAACAPASRASDEATGGLHGNGLVGVTLGGVALVPGGSATVPLAADLTFEVQVANQGDNTETDVEVQVTVGEGNDAIDLEGTIDTIAAGETKSVSIPLTSSPPPGRTCRSGWRSSRCPGEQKTDNNAQTYSVIFTRRPARGSAACAGCRGRHSLALRSARGRPDHDAGHRRARSGGRGGGRAPLDDRQLRSGCAVSGPPSGRCSETARADLVAHAAGLQEAFVQLRDWLEETAERLDERMNSGRAAHRRLGGPTPRWCATTPTARCRAASRAAWPSSTPTAAAWWSRRSTTATRRACT